MDIKVTKMKNTQSSYQFEYLQGLDNLKLISEEEALPPLREAFKALVPLFLKITELNKDKEYKITGLSLSGDDLNRAVITGQCHLSTGKMLLINSPVFESDETDRWDLIEALQAESKKYISGMRRFSQQVLFDQDFDQKEEAETKTSPEVERQKIELDDDIQALDAKIRAKEGKSKKRTQ